MSAAARRRRRSNQPAGATGRRAPPPRSSGRSRAGNPTGRRNAASTGSSLALKSRSTVANCGSTKMRKNSSTAPGGEQHERRIAQRIAEPPRSASARCARPPALRGPSPSAGGFADAHQRDIHRRENPGMLRQRLAETFAGKNASLRARPRSAAGGRIGVGGEQLQPVVDPRAGCAEAARGRAVKMVTSSARGQ